MEAARGLADLKHNRPGRSMTPQHTPRTEPQMQLSRRELLRLSGLGFGSLAFEFLCRTEQTFATGSSHASQAISLRPNAPHQRGPAKAVILLMQNGGARAKGPVDPAPG